MPGSGAVVQQRGGVVVSADEAGFDAFEDQQNLTYMLMQQTQALSRKISALQGEELPATACLAKKPLARLQFSVSLAYHCNLNCKGCAHFSPLSPAQFPDFEEVERDFARLSELFAGKCKYVCLMGGEPLMNPQIEDYCRSSRKFYIIIAFTKNTFFKRIKNTILLFDSITAILKRHI